MISNLVILGAGGDLTERLLLPGLAVVLAENPQAELSLIGSGHTDDPTWAETVRAVFSETPATGPAVERVADTTRWVTADATSPEDLAALLGGLDGRSVLYLALAPAVAADAIAALGEMPPGALPEDLILAVEKPIGSDSASAADVNDALRPLLPDDQVFRVDHFLGMPGVLHLLGLRFANRLLEPLLSREHVAAVDVVFDEDLGLEGRADFYEGTGAAADMLQSHLLQAMAVAMMDPPSKLAPAAVRSATMEVLRAVRLWPGEDGEDGEVAPDAVLLGRYGAGEAGGKTLPAYVEEEGVDPAGTTETFAQLRLEVRSWRWAGVPVTLRSGKAMGDVRQEIRFRFRRQPLPYDGSFGTDRDEHGEVLTLGFEDGAVGLTLQLGDPATGKELRTVTLDATDLPVQTTAYANVLRWLLDGDATFAVAAEGAAEGWRVLEEMRAAWGGRELREYPAGSSAQQVIDALTD